MLVLLHIFCVAQAPMSEPGVYMKGTDPQKQWIPHSSTWWMHYHLWRNRLPCPWFNHHCTYKETNTNNLFRQATSTCRRTCHCDQEGQAGPGESSFFLSPAPAGGSQPTRSRQRAWEKILAKCSKMQQIFLREGPITRWTRRERKLDIFTFHLASSRHTLRNNFGAP